MMVKSMRMIDQKTLNPGQLKTLKEIEEHLAPSFTEELSSKD